MNLKIHVSGIIMLAMFFFMPYTHADTIEIITDRGNVFVLENDPGEYGPGSEATGSGDGTSMLDGLGINSRIIHKEYGGSIIHGRNLAGTEESVKPYLGVDDSTGFVVSALDENNPRVMAIPAFYHKYYFGNGSDTLRQTSPHGTNILGYESVRTIRGDIDVSLHDRSGLVITGTGRAIVKLLDYSDQTLVLTGDLADGTVVRMVDSPHDLVSIPHDPDRGFLIYQEPVNPDIGYDLIPAPSWSIAYTFPPESRINVLAGNIDDSTKTGIFEYLQEASASWYHGKCCRGRYTTTGSVTQAVETSLIITNHPSGYLAIIGDRTGPEEMNIRDIARYGAKLSSIHYSRVVYSDYKIYDTLPAKEYRTKLTGSFEEPVTFPKKSGYLVIDSVQGMSHLKGTALDERRFIDVGGLAPDTGYKITKDGKTMSVGITSDRGVIEIPALEDHHSPGIGGRLYLYEDSLTHMRAADTFGTAVFDHMNNQVIRLDTTKNQAYNAHAYVKIPVVGDVTITKTSLDKRLHLDYIAGDYSTGQNLYFPIIPTFKQVFLSINGIPTHLNIADILGTTGLKIADPVSSTITVVDPSDFVTSIESTAGVITYMIAAADGNAKAHVQATIHGTSEITNTRVFELTPPTPPPPQPRDPLTTWIEVYVNGNLQEVDGKTKTQIFFSDEPVENHAGGNTRTSAFHTAHFSYAPVTATGTISVPVQEGDYVEFYFYSRIYAEGSIPPVPSGYAEIRRSGSAYATSVIEYASINTSL